MTVAELIKELEDQPQDVRVFYTDDVWGVFEVKSVSFGTFSDSEKSYVMLEYMTPLEYRRNKE